MIGISIFHDLLPLPAPAHQQPLNPDEHADPDADWPALPTADFPLFLATCRRRLTGDTFDQLNLTYRAEAQRTDEFVRRHRNELTPNRTPGEFQRHEVTLRIHGTVEQIRAHLPVSVASLEEHEPAAGQDRATERWLRVELRAEQLGWLPPVLASLDRPFVIERPDELRDLVTALADRLASYARRA
ncbi:WYL domain-containing protein [Streptomyces sp. NPDC017086]|uniref:WYL domain-containing protein n=1 Tax=Streptomyces sp. NPDC017086 TaxID=3364976 RepID=UPI003787FEB8